MAELSFQETEALVTEARNKGFRMLQFPQKLEQAFGDYYREASLAELPKTILLTAFIVIAVYQLTFLHIPTEEFSSALGQADGFNGSIKFTWAVIALFFILAFLPRLQFMGKWQQYYLAILTSVILTLVLISYALVTDERYQFILGIELIIGYLFIFSLIKLQTIYAVISSAFSIVLFILSISVIGVEPEWAKIVTILISMNLFGGLYSYTNEYRERERFLHQTELFAEKQHLDAINQETEQENMLKVRLTEFYAVMSGEKNIYNLAEKILGHMIPATHCNAGSLYFVDGDEIKRLASYGVSGEQEARKSLKLGETLLGQAALENEILQIEKAPEDFVILQSGLGTVNRPALCIIPMSFNDEVVAVMELVSLSAIEDFDLRFIKEAGKSIATATRTVFAQAKAKEASVSS